MNIFYKSKTVTIYFKDKYFIFNIETQQVYNKLDFVVNILLKSANMNHIEILANCYIDTISSSYKTLKSITRHPIGYRNNVFGQTSIRNNPLES